MLRDIVIIAANRSYEFRRDDIRLTLLSTGGWPERIRDTFDFTEGGIADAGTPFGAAAPTMPPGLVFNLGYLRDAEHGTIPIRHLFVTYRRIAISAAAPSAALEAVYRRLRELLDGQQSPDGTLALGEPVERLDYSEIVARCSFRPDDILHPALRTIYAETLAAGLPLAGLDVVPDADFYLTPSDAEFDPVDAPVARRARLTLRAERRPDELAYHSVAPLDTDAHIEMLRRIDGAIGAPGSS